MKLYFLLLPVFFIFLSCGRNAGKPEIKIITVSIAPFKYFAGEIGGDYFEINVMVPPGSDPHIYEPFPDQISKLRQSAAYISNGYLGFEMSWLGRFFEINRTMKKLSLGDMIDPIFPEHHHEGDHIEGADPHYWVSPVCAMIMASSVRELLSELDPDHAKEINDNYLALHEKLKALDSAARELLSSGRRKAFMIYHPNLGYLARDYGLEEITVEYEGKEPSPSRLRELIDRARRDSLKMILVQKEFDTRNARAIAHETGSKVVVIDPLSENWLEATWNIINILHKSFNE